MVYLSRILQRCCLVYFLLAEPLSAHLPSTPPEFEFPDGGLALSASPSVLLMVPMAYSGGEAVLDAVVVLMNKVATGRFNTEDTKQQAGYDSDLLENEDDFVALVCCQEVADQSGGYADWLGAEYSVREAPYERGNSGNGGHGGASGSRCRPAPYSAPYRGRVAGESWVGGWRRGS